MPLYEYRCEGCREMEEKLQSLSAPEAHDCPKCGLSAGMKRQISAVSFSLAGAGWYKSDYSKKSEPPVKETTTVSDSDKPAKSGCCGNCSCHS